MSFKTIGLALTAAFALSSVSPVLAQNTTSQSGATGRQTDGTSSPAGSGGQDSTGGQAGVTSGPAAGRPTTLGTGGVTSASPHQADVTRSHGGAAVRNEHGAQGGTRASVRPGASDAGAGVHQGKRQQPRQ